MNEPSREAFEKWYVSTHTGANVLRTRKGYVIEVTRVAWRAFQAGYRSSTQPTVENENEHEDWPDEPR